MKKNNGICWMMLKYGFLNRLLFMDRNPHSNIDNNDDNNFQKFIPYFA